MKLKVHLSLLLVLLTLVACARGDKPNQPQALPKGPATATFTFPDLSDDVTYLSITLEPKTNDESLKASGIRSRSLDLAPELKSSSFDSGPSNPQIEIQAQSGNYTLSAYGYEEAGGAVIYSRVEDISLRPGNVSVTAKGAEAPAQTNRKSVRLTPHMPEPHAFEGKEDLPTRSELQLLSQEDFGSLLSTQSVTMDKPIGEVGRVNANQPYRAHWHEVSFKNSYTDPIVIMNPMSFNGKNPATARVRKVTSDGFEFRIDEWLYQDGRHLEETLSYLVIEKGRHNIGGLVIEAGLTQTNHKFTSVKLEQYFDQTPVILSQSQSFNGPHPVITRHRNVTQDSFEVRLQEEEAQGWHKVEDIAYVALASQVIGGFAPFEVITTEQTLDRSWTDINFQGPYENPIFLGAIQTFNGPNTANLRYRNLDADGLELRVQEEKSMDGETWHRKEVAGYVVFDSRLELTPYPEIPEPTPESFGLQLGTYTAQTSDDFGVTIYEQEDSSLQIFENTINDSDGSILTEIALENLDAESYEGLRLIISDLSDGATFVGEDGTTFEGNPYIDAGSLNSGELGSTFLLFDVTTDQPFSYTLSIIEAQDAFGITDVSPRTFNNDAEQIITVTGHALTPDTMFFAGGQQLERIEVGSDTRAKLRIPKGYAADTYALSVFKLGNVSTELDNAFTISEGAAPIEIDPIENYQSFFSGFVIDANTFDTIPNATVKVESLQGTTGPTGMFLIQGAPVGTFTLSITAPGYTSAQRTVEITQSDETVFAETVYLKPTDVQTNVKNSIQTQSLPGCDIGISSIQPILNTLSGGFACGGSYPTTSGGGLYNPSPDYDPFDEPVGKRRRGGRWTFVEACVQYQDGTPASGVSTNYGRTGRDGVVKSWDYISNRGGGYSSNITLNLELAPWEGQVTPIQTTFNPSKDSRATFNQCLVIPGNGTPDWDDFTVIEKLDSSCSVNNIGTGSLGGNLSHQSLDRISTLNTQFNPPSPLLIRSQTEGFRGVVKRWDRRRFRGGRVVFEIEGEQVPYKLTYPHPDYKDSPQDLRREQRNAAVVTADPRLPTGEAITVKFGAKPKNGGVVQATEYNFDIADRIVVPNMLVLTLPDDALPTDISTPYTVESYTSLNQRASSENSSVSTVAESVVTLDEPYVPPTVDLENGPPPTGATTTRPDEDKFNSDTKTPSSIVTIFRESDLAVNGTAELYVPIALVDGNGALLPNLFTRFGFAFPNADSDARSIEFGSAEIPVRVDAKNGGTVDLSKLVAINNDFIILVSIGDGDCVETETTDGNLPSLQSINSQVSDFYEDLPFLARVFVDFTPWLGDTLGAYIDGPQCLEGNRISCATATLAIIGMLSDATPVGTVTSGARTILKTLDILKLSDGPIAGAILKAVEQAARSGDSNALVKALDGPLIRLAVTNPLTFEKNLKNANTLAEGLVRKIGSDKSEIAYKNLNDVIGNAKKTDEALEDVLQEAADAAEIRGFYSDVKGPFERLKNPRNDVGNTSGVINEIKHANALKRSGKNVEFPENNFTLDPDGKLIEVSGTPGGSSDVDVLIRDSNGVIIGLDDVKTSLTSDINSSTARNQARNFGALAEAGVEVRWVITDTTNVNRDALNRLGRYGVKVVDAAGNVILP